MATNTLNMRGAAIWTAAVIMAFASAFCYSLAAHGQSIPVAPHNDITLTQRIYWAVQTGDWRLLAAFGLLAVVSAVRWLAPVLHNKLGDYFNSDSGAAVLVLIAGYGSAVATARLAGADWSWALARRAAEISFTAAGGYSIVKRILRPLNARLRAFIERRQLARQTVEPRQ